MALAQDSLLDIAKVFVARAATVGSCKRHEAAFTFRQLPNLEDLTPPCLRQPVEIPPERNGYLAALRVCESIPAESPTQCCAVHRALALVQGPCTHELEVSRRTIEPYEPAMDGIRAALDDYPVWQAPAPNDEVDLPELACLRKLGHAWLLRGVIRRCTGEEAAGAQDIRSCLELAHRLRNCQGFMLHLLAGIAMESVVLMTLRRMLLRQETREFALGCLSTVHAEGRKAETVEAFRGEFARVCIPRALNVVRPWNPAPPGSPASFEFPNLAAQMALAHHPAPYNPIETALELICIGEVFLAWVEEGWSVAPAIERMRQHYAEGWPDEIAASPIACKPIGFPPILRARRALLGVENPYGRLMCARTLYTAAEVYRASLLGELRVGFARVLGAACLLGRAPLCLEELEGNGLLDAIPLDPFTDAPLCYEPKDGAIWSPGPSRQNYAEARKSVGSQHDSPYWLRLSAGA